MKVLTHAYKIWINHHCSIKIDYIGSVLILIEIYLGFNKKKKTKNSEYFQWALNYFCAFFQLSFLCGDRRFMFCYCQSQHLISIWLQIHINVYIDEQYSNWFFPLSALRSAKKIGREEKRKEINRKIKYSISFKHEEVAAAMIFLFYIPFICTHAHTYTRAIISLVINYIWFKNDLYKLPIIQCRKWKIHTITY